MSHKNLIEALAAHDMFRQLSGNPTSITMIAAIIKNPMIKKAEKNTLIDMYNRIKSEKDIVVEDLAEEGEEFNMKAIPRVYKNTMSLKISTEMGVKLLETTYPDDMYLLYFLGCLPGGVKFYQLKQMWDQNLEKSLGNLEQLSFLEVGVEKYVLTPYMLSYIDGSIELASKYNYMTIICQFYMDILLDSYRQIGKQQSLDKNDLGIHTDGAESCSSPADSLG